MIPALPARELSPLFRSLCRRGVEVAAHPKDPERLRYRPAVLSPDLSAGLRTHRAAILGLLAGAYSPADADAEYVLGERLGVADGLGMPTHPGSAAWLVAVGESMEACCTSATYGVYSEHGPAGRATRPHPTEPGESRDHRGKGGTPEVGRVAAARG